MATKKNLIKTLVEFTKVNDIDIDYIYTMVQFKYPNSPFKWGHVVGVWGDKSITISETFEFECGCCSDSINHLVQLSDLTTKSLQDLIDDCEKLLFLEYVLPV